MATEPRITQLARILERDTEELDDASAARAAMEDNARQVASAFFHEAADSDDVTSIETALAYLDGRILFFGDLVTEGAGAHIREHFRELVAQWEG